MHIRTLGGLAIMLSAAVTISGVGALITDGIAHRYFVGAFILTGSVLAAVMLIGFISEDRDDD